jgi:hypothetical protein
VVPDSTESSINVRIDSNNAGVSVTRTRVEPLGRSTPESGEKVSRAIFCDGAVRDDVDEDAIELDCRK